MTIPLQYQYKKSLQPLPSTNEDFIEFLLGRTRAFLIEVGWCQEYPEQPTGEVDLMRAVTIVTGAYCDQAGSYGYPNIMSHEELLQEVGSVIRWFGRNLDPTPRAVEFPVLVSLNDRAEDISDIFELLQLAREGYRNSQGPYRQMLWKSGDHTQPVVHSNG